MKPIFRPSLRPHAGSRSGVALVITLIVLALMTIIAVGFLGSMTFQAQTTRRNFESQKARGIAAMGFNTAIAQLRTALNTWDTPYGNENGNFQQILLTPHSTPGFTVTPPTNYWSISPGIISIWKYNSTTPFTNYPLFSLPTDGSTNLANLNAQDESGVYPILGSTNSLPVYWVNVLSNPAVSAASTNTIVGRYAFWVDDENSKINLNTADGVLNTNQPSGTTPGTYMGAGTPTEVSLMALQTSSGGTLTSLSASNMVAFARTSGFDNPRGLLRLAATSADSAYNLYTNNLFNLTVASRSPDFNIFGQPKMALIPGSPLANPYLNPTSGPTPAQGEFAWNMTTLQYMKELFPSVAGTAGSPASPSWTGVIPSITITNSFFITNGAGNALNAVTQQIYSGTKWPMAMGSWPADQIDPLINISALGDHNPWDNGLVIARYLAGTNAAGQPITWPRFPGTTTTATSYSGKYTLRQIDSITAQTVQLAARDTSPDMGWNDHRMVRTGDSATRGWLSGKLVNGIGRSPKLDKVLVGFTVSDGSTYGFSTNAVIAPDIQTAIYIELWMPSRFSGVSAYHNDQVGNNGYIGSGNQMNYLNCQDFSSNYGGVAYGPGMLPKIPANTTYMTNYPQGNGPSTIPTPPDGTATNYSYWGNNLLRTDQGVDWSGSPHGTNDPDQYLAKTYHAYELATNTTGPLVGKYYGSGPYTTTNAPVLQMSPFVKTSGGVGAYYVNEWAPGEYRCVANTSGMSVKLPFSTNAAGGYINISGGIAYLNDLFINRTSEAGAVPLDAMRGMVWPSGGPTGENRTSERFYNTLSPYTNVLAAVIPMTAPGTTNTPIAVPPKGSVNVNSAWVYAKVYDPLVNKFPGDWNVTVSSGAPSTSMQYGTATTLITSFTGSTTLSDAGNASRYSSYAESSSTITSFSGAANGWTDPDSYWLPTIDNDAAYNHPGTIDLPQIPRTSRFPSVGYLQYVRTGIIPDDESVAYSQQKGTPFRLLNFNQISDSSQTIHSVTYPDWAMLNLFYIPSSLLSYGSPYEAFAGTKTVTQVPTSDSLNQDSVNDPVLVTYSNTNAINTMYLFGTYGGATSGRINPNGAVIYSTNTTTPTPGITRTVPLQALMQGLVINQTQGGTYTNNLTGPFPAEFHVPKLTAGTAVNGATIAGAIVSYLTNNPGNGGAAMPLRMPEEIANISTIAALVPASPDVNPTRNDLVRQIIGNLTTTSNTFSVWVEGQSIQKSRANLLADAGTPANFGLYQTGDQITGTVRYHFVVARELDMGVDGVYGNAVTTGPDGIVGTMDDTATVGSTLPVNPTSPDYKYRVVYAEEIR
jgi:hypothetical protein